MTRVTTTLKAVDGRDSLAHTRQLSTNDDLKGCSADQIRKDARENQIRIVTHPQFFDERLSGGSCHVTIQAVTGGQITERVLDGGGGSEAKG